MEDTPTPDAHGDERPSEAPSAQPKTRWTPAHLWCAATLSACAELPQSSGWTVRVFGVVDPAALPGLAAGEDSAVVGDLLIRDLASMQAKLSDPLATWLGDGIHILPITSVVTPPGVADDDSELDLGELPVLVAGAAVDSTVAGAVLGFRAAPPLLGLVAATRGYVTTAWVDRPPTGHDSRADGAGKDLSGGAVTDGAVPARVWHGAGPQWPADVTDDPAGMQTQPVLMAFAVGVDGESTATLAQRVAAPGQDLGAGAEQAWVDLTAAGHLGFTSLLDSPQLALEIACGWDRSSLARDDTLFQPGWLVGRWWLHGVWTTLLEWVASGDEDAGIGVPEPLLDLSHTWEAVRQDQGSQGPNAPAALGPLFSPDEARLLPDPLFAAVAGSRTPTQDWLWREIETVLTDAGDSDGQGLGQLRALWEQWPQLHEPDRFLGRSDSLAI